MAGSERTMVAGVHRSEHVEGLWPAHLAEHEPVGSHAQGTAQQGSHAHFKCTVIGRRSCLKSHDVLGL